MNRLRFSFKAGAGLCGTPTLGPDGTCYVGGLDGKLYAVAPDGSLRWSVVTEGPIEAAPCYHPEGQVVFGSYDGIVRAVDPDAGPCWTADLGAPVMTTPCFDDEGRLWFGADNGRLYAFDHRGKILARLTLADLVVASPVCVHGHVYVADESLYGTDGTRLPLAAEPIVAAAAADADGTLYVGSWDGFLYCVREGALVWNAPMDGQIYAACTVGPDGQIVATTRAGKVVALANSGERIWARMLTAAVYGSPALAADGVCFVAASDGTVNAMDLANGGVVWQETVGGAVRTSLALADEGTVYVSCLDGRLYAFEGGAGGPADSAWPQFHRDARRTGRLMSNELEPDDQPEAESEPTEEVTSSDAG